MDISDLGLSWLGSEQVFGLLLCLMLAILGYKMKSWIFMTVSSLGWLVIGLQIYQVTTNPLIFMLMFAIAIAQSLMAVKSGDE